MIYDVYQYKNRFERFKDHHFPAWLKRLWPVRYLHPIERLYKAAVDRYEMIDNGDGTYTHQFTMKGQRTP